ncbi:MAG: MgtC/SapB family protein [Anaerovibrio sp.]|nr:MgtC/SapB family protein [Anaerovibrio sp.]
MYDVIEKFLQLALACVLGGMIGYERQSRRKSAGLRTNMLVCLGSCLIMMLSYDIYKQVEGMTNADPARLGAQVVSGIGFLGAGAIMKEGLSITGLTTAACLWVVAGVGLAVGAGFYTEAVMTTILVVITVGTLSHWEFIWSNHANIMQLVLRTDSNPSQLHSISECLAGIDIEITKIKVREEYAVHIQEGDAVMVIEMVIVNAGHQKNIDITDALRSLPGIHGIELT